MWCMCVTQAAVVLVSFVVRRLVSVLALSSSVTGTMTVLMAPTNETVHMVSKSITDSRLCFAPRCRILTNSTKHCSRLTSN